LGEGGIAGIEELGGGEDNGRGAEFAEECWEEKPNESNEEESLAARLEVGPGWEEIVGRRRGG